MVYSYAMCCEAHFLMPVLKKRDKYLDEVRGQMTGSWAPIGMYLSDYHVFIYI